jgi:hypothetical protein
MSDQFHRHCLLQKGDLRQTAWIPEIFAKKNKYLSLKQKDDSWDDGWKIIEIGTRQSSKYMLERSQDYKLTRKASDV